MQSSIRSGNQAYPEIDQRDPYMNSTLQSRDGQFRDRALSLATSTKLAKSNDFFKTTKVDSCSYVVVKNGVAQAIPFRPKPKPVEYVPLYSQSENQYKLTHYSLTLANNLL